MQRFVPGHLGAQVPHLQMLVCVFESYILSRWNRKEGGEKNIPNRVGFCFEFVFFISLFLLRPLYQVWENTARYPLCCGGGEAWPRCVTHQMSKITTTQLCLDFCLCK